ncbi:hypothetical protein [Granulicella rosea]|uniref:hypothetical protein n=1 Tax=Granulicella rosea TaxID=474952 RepID=UPI00115D2070|nr:hypothetical protein [Granulicella rosea]
MLQFGAQTWRMHVLATSRNPGYWTYEAVVYALSSLGGSLLSNLGSLAVSCVALWRFLRIAQRLRVGHPVLMAACFVVTPVVVIAATSTMDYMWSLLCLVLAAEGLFDDRPVQAALLGGLAISFRGANAVLVAGGYAAAIGYEIYRRRGLSAGAVKTAISGIAAAVLGCSVYVLSYRLAHNTLAFMAPMTGPASLWTWKGYLGRFLYKGMYAIGPLAMVVSAYAAAVYPWRQRREPDSEHAKLMAISAGFFLSNVALFLKFPIEVSYLIPGIFFFLLLAGATIFQERRWLGFALFAAIGSLNLVTPVFAQPNIPGLATSARLHIALNAGTLSADVKTRRMFLGCEDAICWIARDQMGHH